MMGYGQPWIDNSAAGTAASWLPGYSFYYTTVPSEYENVVPPQRWSWPRQPRAPRTDSPRMPAPLPVRPCERSPPDPKGGVADGGAAGAATVVGGARQPAGMGSRGVGRQR
jgi:hypothetical protein